MDFKTFEGQDPIKDPVSKPEYLREPQGKLRRTASVKVWDKIGVGVSSVDKKYFEYSDINSSHNFLIS